MLLILEEYFREHPIKRKIVEGLYERGISVQNGRFYTESIELSISEVAKSFRVNRRTVYETIRVIESTPGVREIMANLRPSPDLKGIATLTGDQVATLRISPGYFPKVMSSLLETVRKYSCYIKEIYGKNHRKDDILLRIIFSSTVPKKIFQELSTIDGVDKIYIDSPSISAKEIICPKCEVKVCTNKLSSGIFEDELPEI